jgi:hypothetical protein
MLAGMLIPISPNLREIEDGTSHASLCYAANIESQPGHDLVGRSKISKRASVALIRYDTSFISTFLLQGGIIRPAGLS